LLLLLLDPAEDVVVVLTTFFFVFEFLPPFFDIDDDKEKEEAPTESAAAFEDKVNILMSYFCCCLIKDDVMRMFVCVVSRSVCDGWCGVMCRVYLKKSSSFFGQSGFWGKYLRRKRRWRSQIKTTNQKGGDVCTDRAKNSFCSNLNRFWWVFGQSQTTTNQFFPNLLSAGHVLRERK